MPGQTGVDHGSDPGDRQRGFGDVGGEDDLAAAHVCEHVVLLFRRHVPEEREHRMPLSLGGCGQFPLAAHDLAHARQKDEHVAGRGAEGLGHGRGDHLDEVTLFASA